MPKFTPRKVNAQFFFLLHMLSHFLRRRSHILLLYTGAVCVRVPSSLKAGVELCGASVDISPEVVLHRVENSTAEGQTTVTGKPLFFIMSHSLAQ